MCKMHNAKIGCLNIPGLISYKGNWECMNDFKVLLSATQPTENQPSPTITMEVNNDQLLCK